MSDPCGIVDTIQSNLRAIDPAAPALCLGGKDTPAQSATEDVAGGSYGASPSNERSEGQGQPKAVGDVKDTEADNDTTAANNDEEKTKNNEKETIVPKKRGGFLHRWTTRKTPKGDEIPTANAEKEDEKKEESAATATEEKEDETETEEEAPPKMAAVSDLSDLTRKICVVTTAGLPWRTGTAVNPLARALYLTRGRPKHSVTLMIPWLETREEQAKVYGSKNVFETPEEQEAWTRTYSRERILNANSDTTSDTTLGKNNSDTDTSAAKSEEKGDETTTDDEVDNLQIRFYPAKYHNLFGSIFATMDICALIPQEEADIAILEEPEHLTWFRSLPPSSSGSSSSATSTTAGAMESMMDNDNSCGACAVDSEDEMDCNDEMDNDNSIDHINSTSEEDELKRLEELAVIGWTAKFSYVVGILHTNYSAYMRQYGLAGSIVTSNALQALSSVCVRAYTHRLIRLSDTLPELDKPKEITCNVHGVRSEFFVDQEKEQVDEGAATAATDPYPLVTETEEPQPESEEEKADESESDSNMEDDRDGGNTETTGGNATGDIISNASIEDDERFRPEPVYFIGKVIWAKGFDKLLEIEDLFRKETGDYFPIDVYGSGGDYDAISRAFLGRSGLAKRVTSSGSVKSLKSLDGTQARDRSKSPVTDAPSPQPSTKDQTAALLFSKEGNLRGQIDDLQTVASNELVVEVQTCETPLNTEGGHPSSARNYPKQIIGQLGEKTKETGTGVTKAIAKLSDKLTNLGFRSLYRDEADDSETNNSDEASTATGSSLASKFRFDPPKSRYELRRNSIPARFLGVKDHALLRDIPGHKIFVNLSITEVLCTTTAEAMAMGKFVVIPEHRKFLPSLPLFLLLLRCSRCFCCVTYILHSYTSSSLTLSLSTFLLLCTMFLQHPTLSFCSFQIVLPIKTRGNASKRSNSH
jgi:hypothetical protein